MGSSSTDKDKDKDYLYSYQRSKIIKTSSFDQTVLDEATEPWGIKVERVEM